MTQAFMQGAAVLALLPSAVRATLAATLHEAGGPLYLVGGAVRDVLLGRKAHDVDLCLPKHAADFARRFADCAGGAFVLLDADEDVARVLVPGVAEKGGNFEVDFAAFRTGTDTIEADLRLRDFTVNALALDLSVLLAGETEPGTPLPLIDPLGGATDLQKRLVRLAFPGAFQADPLRMLRGYRLAASLCAELDAKTRAAVRRDCAFIARSAGERVAFELNAIMATPRAHAAIRAMLEDGLLFAVIPELALGQGVTQPRAFHHLNVLEHNLEALKQAEICLARPAAFFPDCAEPLEHWLALPENVLVLKWAALLHDVGKPRMRRVDETGKISFHAHSEAGVELVHDLAQRLHWSTKQTERVCRLVNLHMRPYHLLSVPELTLRACIRAIQAAGTDLPGLALVNMADTLAGKGEQRPADLEEQAAALATRLLQVQAERVAVVQSAPPLLTGHDLIAKLGLQPGPLFKHILEAVQLARMEGSISTKKEALALAKDAAKKQGEHI